MLFQQKFKSMIRFSTQAYLVSKPTLGTVLFTTCLVFLLSTNKTDIWIGDGNWSYGRYNVLTIILSRAGTLPDAFVQNIIEVKDNMLLQEGMWSSNPNIHLEYE